MPRLFQKSRTTACLASSASTSAAERSAGAPAGAFAFGLAAAPCAFASPFAAVAAPVPVPACVAGAEALSPVAACVFAFAASLAAAAALAAGTPLARPVVPGAGVGAGSEPEALGLSTVNHSAHMASMATRAMRKGGLIWSTPLRSAAEARGLTDVLAGLAGCLVRRRRDDADAELAQLLVVDPRGGAGERVAAARGLRERDDLADRVAPAEQRHDAVDAHRDAAVRGRAVAQRVEQEAEAAVGVLLAQPDDLEDLALDLGRVDADRAAAELPAVDHEVVAARVHRAGVVERPLRRRERVVDRGPATALPRLEHREVGDPEHVVAVGRDQPEAPPELEPQRAERLGRGPFLVGDEQDEVALRPGERAGRRRFLVLGEELRDRRAPAAVLDVRPRDRLAAVAADDVVQTVELRPRHVARARVQRPHRAAVAQHRLEDA